MALSKIDILNKKFSRKALGYDRDEVDHLMVEIAEILGQETDTQKELQAKIKRLEKQLVEYKKRDEALRDTLLSSQKMVDELKLNASREAKQIIDGARAKGEDTLRQAHSRCAEVHEEIENLKRQRNRFKVQVTSLIRSHLDLLEAENPEAEHKEALESKVTFLQKAE